MTGREQPTGATTLDLALSLLDGLCRDSLEVPLDHVDGLIATGDLDDYDVSWKFWQLRELLRANLSGPPCTCTFGKKPKGCRLHDPELSA